MQVLPSSRNTTQKVCKQAFIPIMVMHLYYGQFVIGDSDGVLSCFGVRRGDTNVNDLLLCVLVAMHGWALNGIM